MKHFLFAIVIVASVSIAAMGQGMPRQAQPDIQVPDSPPGNQNVFVTQSGSLYHLRSCKAFSTGYSESQDSIVNTAAATGGAHGGTTPPPPPPPFMNPAPERVMMSLKEAKLQGYKPCKTCMPPK